jgi:hypothetical protein
MLLDFSASEGVVAKANITNVTVNNTKPLCIFILTLLTMG